MYCRCNDVERIQVVKVAAQNIEKLSVQLIDCANEVAKVEEEGEESSETSQHTAENKELLRRHWASQVRELMSDLFSSIPPSLTYFFPLSFTLPHVLPQVHLLTAHVDDLTAGVAAPLDRLVDIALQASRTSGIAKQHLLSQFEGRASYLTDHALEKVSRHFDEATMGLSQQPREAAVDNVAMAISFLRKLTPHAVGAAKSLASMYIWIMAL